jgi:hypothetical protein
MYIWMSHTGTSSLVGMNIEVLKHQMTEGTSGVSLGTLRITRACASTFHNES